MQTIDLIIVAIFFLALTGVALFFKRFVSGVSDFLVANRSAGRYLLSVGQGTAGLGAITVIVSFEQNYISGFCSNWWLMLGMPLGLLISLSGYIVYRYRETRAMTLAQFFEIRYNKPFRIFTGFIAWVSGIINMGIFPAVGANFFIHFLDLPQTVSLGTIDIPTFPLIMIVELVIAIYFIFSGGMIVVMITDFLQGIFSYIALTIILFVLFSYFSWEQIIDALKTAPENASMINPFKTTQADGFDLYFFLMNSFVIIYGIGAWQGSSGYNAAAKNAHEAKMAGIISHWRGIILTVMLLIMPICAFTLLHNPDFTDTAQIVQESINKIDGKVYQNQMTVPLSLKKIFQPGIIGLFAAVMIAASISNLDTYLHSWGSIFIQDVILPFKKKGFTEKQHIWLLRLSIVFVAVFIFFFSLLFKQKDYIYMFFQITGAIYMGGAGAVLVGGLYWKHGSTAGAWASMIIGGSVSVAGIVIQQAWPSIVPNLLNWFPDSDFLITNPEKFPFDGMRMSFFAILCAISSYIFISLFRTCILKKPTFNLEKMLHRGKYALKDEHAGGMVLVPTGLKALLPTKEFTKWDKFLHFSLIVWIVSWYSFFIGVTIYHFVVGTTDKFWVKFWYFYLWFYAILAIITTIWFVWGGSRDLIKLVYNLKATKKNKFDDGRVIDHSNLEDKLSEEE